MISFESANETAAKVGDKDQNEEVSEMTYDSLDVSSKNIEGMQSFQAIEGRDSRSSKGANCSISNHEKKSTISTPIYESKWASSQMNNDNVTASLQKEEGQDDSLVDFKLVNEELPIFANDKCRRLHQLTKQLEIERDEATRSIKENENRISIMHEHLQDVRQEIDSTNALFAAKNKEIATEKHLIALDERERAATVAEIKLTDSNLSKQKEKLRAMQNQIHILIDEREKLKIDLNWNQEELEQWATAAAKKEADTLALEKYTRADEVKIKELTLKLENMTKKSVNKRAELDNEIAENHAKKLEVERLGRTFREQHEERRMLVNQWQETVSAMKERDLQINDVSNKYVDAKQELDIQQSILEKKREALGSLKVRKEPPSHICNLNKQRSLNLDGSSVLFCKSL